MRPVVHRLRAAYQGRVDVVSIGKGAIRGKKIAGLDGVAFTPTFVFVRPDGGLQSVIVGEMDEQRLAAELNRLALAGSATP